jgi:hypothetical protein
MNESNPSSQDGLSHLGADIFATQTGEIACDQAALLIGRCADLQLDEHAAHQQYPALFQHLHFCPDCTDEYRMVTGYAQRETAGQLRTPPTLPPLPSEFRSSVLRNTHKIIRSIFGGFAFAAAQSALRGASDRRQAVIDLANDRQLLVETGISTAAPNLRTLHLRFNAEEDQVQAAAALALTVGGALTQAAQLDESGEVTLLDIPPATYELRLTVGDIEYRIEQFEIS